MTVMTVDVQKTLTILASMYLCKPTKDGIEGWRSALSDTEPDYLSGMKAALDGIDTASEQELEDVLWEYTRLFIGPYRLPCPPWESVYTSPKRLMMQDAADQVRQIYAEAGFAINSADVMPDHIGAELNFLALLLRGAHSGTGGKDEYMRLTGRLMDEHLLKWAPDFTQDMEEAAETLFFKELARATRKVIDLVGR
jgi:TorA maturation chaperone TorD